MFFFSSYPKKIDEKFNYLLGIIQTSISKLAHNNYTNITNTKKVEENKILTNKIYHTNEFYYMKDINFRKIEKRSNLEFI